MTEPDVQEIDAPDGGQIRVSSSDSDDLAYVISELMPDPWILVSVPKGDHLEDKLSMIFRSGRGVTDMVDMLVILEGAVAVLRVSLQGQGIDPTAAMDARTKLDE